MCVNIYSIKDLNFSQSVIFRTSTHNAVTLEPLQVTPSQRSPHGSLDPCQLGGMFSQTCFKELSTAAGSKANQNGKTVILNCLRKHLLEISQQSL